ncbi:transposase [Candidatus Flexifilum breve]|uniref:transposase n=1 Tax=Candidatus Flexifilum breve TaxID=3140694 RepID=UPI0031CCB57F
MPGLGDTTIATLLAEVPDIRAFDSAAQFAAYAGVTPRHHRSGSSVRGRTRISKCGNAPFGLPSISRRWLLYAIIPLFVPLANAFALTDWLRKRWSSPRSVSCCIWSTVCLSPVVPLIPLSLHKSFVLDFLDGI